MTSRLLMTLQVVVPPPQKLGAVPHGTRVIAPIAGGSFEGPRLRGKVLPGGGDWTLLRSDGVLELDLRITLETDDGALIYMSSFGLRHGPPEVLAALARGESVEQPFESATKPCLVPNFAPKFTRNCQHSSRSEHCRATATRNAGWSGARAGVTAPKPVRAESTRSAPRRD